MWYTVIYGKNKTKQKRHFMYHFLVEHHSATFHTAPTVFFFVSFSISLLDIRVQDLRLRMRLCCRLVDRGAVIVNFVNCQSPEFLQKKWLNDYGLFIFECRGVSFSCIFCHWKLLAVFHFFHTKISCPSAHTWLVSRLSFLLAQWHVFRRIFVFQFNSLIISGRPINRFRIPRGDVLRGDYWE